MSCNISASAHTASDKLQSPWQIASNRSNIKIHKTHALPTKLLSRWQIYTCIQNKRPKIPTTPASPRYRKDPKHTSAPKLQKQKTKDSYYTSHSHDTGRLKMQTDPNTSVPKIHQNTSSHDTGNPKIQQIQTHKYAKHSSNIPLHRLPQDTNRSKCTSVPKMATTLMDDRLHALQHTYMSTGTKLKTTKAYRHLQKHKTPTASHCNPNIAGN